MKTSPILAFSHRFLAAGLLLNLPALAQSPADSTPIDIAARRESVVNLERHIEQRELRMDQLIQDIKTLDQRVESKVEEIVGMLGASKDSEESKVRVARLKADVIVGLKKTIDYYKRNEDAVREQLKKPDPNVPRETLENDHQIFRNRIEKRVGQITQLASTFTDPKELEKYEVISTRYWNGWSRDNMAIAEDWKQNRRESRHTEAGKTAVIQGLQESIDYQTKRIDYLKEKLKGTNLTQIERELYQSEIAQNESIIEQRKVQIEEFASSVPPETESLDRSTAHNMELLINDSREDLREDFFSIFRNYAELNRARAELKGLTDNLAARKAWLADYDAKSPK